MVKSPFVAFGPTAALAEGVDSLIVIRLCCVFSAFSVKLPKTGPIPEGFYEALFFSRKVFLQTYDQTSYGFSNSFQGLYYYWIFILTLI